MAYNLATKYEKGFAAAYSPKSYLEGKVSKKYTFEGAKSIKVYSPVPAPLTDYTRAGTARYGTPTEVDNTLQALTLTQDKGFAKTLDRGNYSDSTMNMNAGAFMREQTQKVIVPTVEKYAFSQFFKLAGKVQAAGGALTKSNIVDEIGTGITALQNAFADVNGAYLYVGASNYKKLKMASEWLAVDSLAEKSLERGVVGAFMGAKVVLIPDSYMPESAEALLARPEALLNPVKLESLRTHNNPPGIDGWLMEGRIYYDAFVLGAMADGVWALVTNAKQQAAPTITYTAGSTNTIAITSANSGGIKYTLDGSDPRYSETAQVYSAAVSTAGMTSGANVVVKAVALGGASTPHTSDVTVKEITIGTAS